MSGNSLKQIRDQVVIMELLTTVKESAQDIFIWKFLGGSKLMGKVRLEAIRKFKNDFCIVPTEGQDRAVMELMGSQNHIDIYVPESALLLRCIIKQVDAPFRYYVSIPEFVAQAERRKSFRLNTHEDGDLKLCFAKPMSGTQRPVIQHFMKTCFDVSTGGLSFLVSKAEYKFFEAKDEISQVELRAKGITTKLSLQIMMVKEIDPNENNGLSYKAYKVSCKFLELDQVTKKYLEKYIFERIKEDLCAIN